MARQPAVAGQFYPASPDQLRKTIKGMVDETVEKQDVMGVLVPHAGYVYSGPVAGAVFSRIKFKDTFVILCPNHTGLGKRYSLMTSGTWRTPLGDVEIDAPFAKRLLEITSHVQDDVSAHLYEHAIEVQLPFLQYFRPDVKIVPIVMAMGDVAVFKQIGREIAQVIKELKREAVIVASSDMTHYETQESAKAKDGLAIQAILDMNEDELVRRVERDDITMCGYAPAAAMISAARELGATRAELVTYRTSGDAAGDYSSVVGYAGIIVGPPSPLARLARETVEKYVRERKVPAAPELTPEMTERAGVFVSIHKLGELRGCIGTFEPQTGSVAEEIIANAISSATRDPRFPPVHPSELKDLDYSVDVLTRPVPVKDTDKLDPKRFGVIVECGWRRGLLLPDLEGVDSVEQQISICQQKAGISPGEPVKLYCFEVKRYK